MPEYTDQKCEKDTEYLSGLWAEIEQNSGNCSAQVTRDREGWLSVEKRNYGQVFESLGLELIRIVFES